MSAATVLLLVFGGALAVEGLGWALAPDAMRRASAEAMAMLDSQRLSRLGLLCTALGLLMIWIGVRLHG
ncbi:hypothetical protein GCM10009069_02850 [Algimonas arctica]|uniref:DUF2065 domain-containing protein n=1 Tax=Algimonas arctica TaxID=1479486 RepID=A0A8J3CN58_9PROT|nr:DUF2065 domain-containing protein [Algimonas arctica]GHA83015.1 hypothetical protein GCM10009069_02850 [Algimonas arctica]